MSYSNINKDKAQVRPHWSIKEIIALILGIFFGLSAVVNGWRQFRLLKLAQKTEQETQEKIKKIEWENQKFEEEIKYATTSMGIKRNIIKYYGVGSGDDYWLNLPKDSGNNYKADLSKTIEKMENWEKWWRLFTN